MELILWRHADAEDAHPRGDGARRLTRKGVKQAERLARWLLPHLEGQWRVVVSPAARALETVAPLDLPYEVCDTVSTGADSRSVLAEVDWPEGGQVIVVGHQGAEVSPARPFAAQLLGGMSGDVSVRKGSILWFSSRNRDGRRKTVLKVVLDPDMLERPEKGGK